MLCILQLAPPQDPYVVNRESTASPTKKRKGKDRANQPPTQILTYETVRVLMNSTEGIMQLIQVSTCSQIMTLVIDFASLCLSSCRP